MSDNYLWLVPFDPHWQPEKKAVAVSVNVLAGLFPTAGCVRSHFKNSIVFFDAGSNMESITCPSCSADLVDWWGNAMAEAHRSDFRDLSVVTPCCQNETSLNDLKYVWPAAFANFALEAVNPGVKSITDEQRMSVEQTLGSPLKIVWQRI